MFIDTLQEHLDHEAGAFRCEQEAAFALSRREFDNGMAAVRKLTDAGRFVVALAGPAYCKFTDAILGQRFIVHSDHATREEANERVDELEGDYGDGADETSFVIFPLPAPPASAAADLGDDDIPF